MSNVVRPDLKPTQEPAPLYEGRYKVVIYNNDHTEYSEVVRILMAATGCDLEEAAIETWEAHTFGHADVHFAEEHVCHEVATVIAGIGVRTSVQPEWN